MIVLASDAHNKKPTAVPAAVRLKNLQALKVADEVVVGDSNGFAQIVRRLKPDVIVLGYDQKLPDAETGKVVAELGARVVHMPWFPGKEKTVPAASGHERKPSL